MALFSRKTAETKAKPAPKAVSTEVRAKVKGTTADVSSVIKGPRITEKATVVADKNIYVFNVSVDATKERVKKAISALYKVTPERVNIVTIPRKKTRSARSRKVGYTVGGKKAYVYLKEGDKIEFA